MNEEFELLLGDIEQLLVPAHPDVGAFSSGLPLGDPDPEEVPGSGAPRDPVSTVRVGSVTFDLDDPRLEASRTVETVAVREGDRLTVFTDTDGDGRADHVATIRPDGSFDAWRLASETEEGAWWECTRTGRVGGSRPLDPGECDPMPRGDESAE